MHNPRVSLPLYIHTHIPPNHPFQSYSNSTTTTTTTTTKIKTTNGKHGTKFTSYTKKGLECLTFVLLHDTQRVSKNKIWSDLNIMIKRAKIAGKSLQNLLFHHHHNWAALAANRPSNRLSIPSHPPYEYEYSCTNTPITTSNKFSLFSYHKKHHMDNQPKEVALDIAAMIKAMEMIHSEATSPALPGFGRSPMVRQLRVTDSPFPLTSVDEDNRVDEAAEQFIIRFYNNLNRQKQICGGDTPVL